MKRVLVSLILGAALSGAAFSASAQTCGGFTDVFPSNFFCNDVEWIKNRGVTTGFADNTYRPNDYVLRSQMAAFMRRLGDALTPELVNAEGINLFGQLGTTDQPVGSTGIMCSTGDVPVTGYPRKVLINGVGSFWPDAAGRMVVYPVLSTDGGTSWARIGGNIYVSHEVLAGGQNLAIPTTTSTDLVVGTTYRFALYLRALAGGSAVNFGEGECRLTVAVFSRTGTSTPRDERPPRE